MAGVAALLLLRKRGASASVAALPSGVASDERTVRVSSAIEPEFLATPTYSVSDNIREWKLDNAKRILDGIKQGAHISSDLSKLVSKVSPVAGLVVRVVGGILGFFKALTQGKLPPPLREIIPALPAQAGFPYRPDQAERTNEGLVMWIPANPEEAHPGAVAEIVIPWAVLNPMFPGVGSIEACIASGMFAWRPFDHPTPFSELLYRLAPWLGDYELTYIGKTIGDLDTPIGAVSWRADLSLSSETPTEEESARLVIHARRYAAHYAMHDAPRTVIHYKDPVTGGCCNKDISYRVLHDTRNFAWWMGVQMRNHPEDGWTKAQVQAVLADAPLCTGQEKSAAAEMLGKNLHGRNGMAQKVWKYPDTQSIDLTARPRTQMNMGFPGAWRLVGNEVSVKEPEPEQTPVVVEEPQLDFSLANSTRLLDATRTRLAQSGPEPVAVVAESYLAADANRTVEVGLLENAAEFWLPKLGPVQHKISEFRQFFGDNTGVLAALARGDVAWKPNGLPPEIENWWLSKYPLLGSAKRHLSGWEPFA